MAEDAQTLAEWAIAHNQGPLFRTLPPEIQEQAIAGWQSGLSGSMIVGWLQSQGYTWANRHTISGWLRANYPRPKDQK